MPELRNIGRYAVYAELASGGMATVHLARQRGQAGFARTVAIKRLHPNFAKDPDFVSMFLDEARLAARIRHANVVPVVDVEAADGELFLVMEYVHGESLSKLLKTERRPLPPAVAARIAADVLYGLDAAHDAHDERGEPLHIVHRDVSPQNVLVGVDGISRVTDFGVAKAVNRIQTTHDGQLKGKLSYMSPEQLEEKPVDRRTDIYAASVVLWEMLTGKRLHLSSDPGATIRRILEGKPPPPSRVCEGIPPELDAIVLRGLARNADDRFATGQEMAVTIEKAVRVEPAANVARWVREVAKDSLAERAAKVAELETSDPDASGGREQGSLIAADLARAAQQSLADVEQPTVPLRVSDPGTGGSASAGTDARATVTLDSRSVTRARRKNVAVGVLGIVAAALLVSIVALSVRSEPEQEAPAARPEQPPAPVTSVTPLVAEVATPATTGSSNEPAPDAGKPDASHPPKTSRGWPPRTKPTPTAKPKSAFGSLTRE